MFALNVSWAFQPCVLWIHRNPICFGWGSHPCITFVFYLLAVVGSSAKRRRVMPSAGSTSVSETAKNSLGNLQQEAPLYSHWLALQMYDVYCDALNAVTLDGDVTLSVDDKRYVIGKSALDTASESVKNACRPNASSSHRAMVCGDEVSMTSMVARALDRFVFPDARFRDGAFLNQATSRKRTSTPETADYGLVKFVDSWPYSKAAWDGKKIDLAHSVRESVLYGINSISVNNDTEKWAIAFGCPHTTSETIIQLYLPIHRTLLTLEIARGEPWNKAILCLIYVLSHCILYDEPELNFPESQPLLFPIPFKDDPEQYSFVCGERMNLLYGNSQIHKLFDKENFDIPLQLMSTIDGIQNSGALLEVPKLHFTSLTKDKRFFKITYDFIDGDHVPKTLEQFVGVLNTLDCLHRNGYVHGDIRVVNIVFHDTSSTLIDFDLCRKEGCFYPSTYIYYKDERHPAAKRNRAMKKIHDRYSLMQVIKTYIVDVPAKVTSDLLDESIPLSKVKEDIEQGATSPS